MHIYSFVSMLFTLFMAGCEDKGVEPPPPGKEEKKWEEIGIFRNTDVRYMVQHNGVLYVAGVVILNSSTSNILYKTEDGVKWDTLKTFERTIGPIAFHEDTLTILESGRTWKYHTSFGWQMFWQHLIAADHTRDMVWLNDKLFVFDSDFGLMYSKDTVREMRELFNTPITSKFVRHIYKGKQVFYTRPYYVFEDKIYRFDGLSFEVIMSGVKAEENIYANYPSIYLYNDTVYAGFNTPSRVKKLVNEQWIDASDTIQNTPYADQFTPTLKNRITSIVFHNGRFYIGTEWIGILECADSGWVPLSSGLRLAFPEYQQYELYSAVVQLESFNKKLFVAYGEPWYAPVTGGRGIYYYSF